MRAAVAPVLLLCGPSLYAGAAMAQEAPSAYDHCMADAAMKASYGTIAETDIYTAARGQCADVRAAMVAGRANDSVFIAALDAADAERARNVPGWIRGVRERRRVRAMQGERP